MKATALLLNCSRTDMTIQRNSQEWVKLTIGIAQWILVINTAFYLKYAKHGKQSGQEVHSKYKRTDF